MLLKNFYNAVNSLLIGNYTSNTIGDDTNRLCKDTHGSEVHYQLRGDGSWINGNFSLLDCNLVTVAPNTGSGSFYKTCLSLGSGENDVSFEDYTLSQLVYTDGSNVPYNGLTVVYPPTSRPTTVESDNDGFNVKSRIIITNNNTDKTIKITEWGLLINSAKSQLSSGFTGILMYREKLTTPFLVEPQETFFFDLNGRVNNARPTV